VAVSETYQMSREEMRKYAGKYVAVMDGKVVASGRGLFKKVRKLEQEFPDKRIVVTYIPKEDLLIL
jgi:hypothetical protein